MSQAYKTLITAENFRHYQEFLREQELDPTRYKYVHSMENVAGMHDVDIIVLSETPAFHYLQDCGLLKGEGTVKHII